ncbi:TPA: TonB-dependent receptor [Candidatus Poribacteria bacterium]|nr:TonB-dependent receptor [Candidatus Poribacteria bacterium]
MLSKIKLMVMLLGVMVFALLLANVVIAEEAKEEKAEKAKEEKELAFDLGKVVITGTKTEKRLKDVPVRTEIITAADIKAKGAVNLYEALEGMPGIRVEQQCSYCNFSIVRMQGLESGHLQVLIDGQPIFSGLAGVYGLQQVPTANIERIEVVKGAGSALYGSSAIAGAINIITKKPTEEPMVKFTSTFGTYGTNDYTFAASTRRKNADVMLTAQKNTGGEIDEDDDGFTDRVKTDNVAAGVRANWYKLFGDDQLTFTGRTTNEGRAGGYLGGPEQTADWDNPFSAGAENIKTTRYEAGIGYLKKFQYGNEIALNLAYSLHHRDATNDSFLGDYEATHPDVDETPIDESVAPIDEMEPYIADENLYVVDVSYSHPLLEKHRLLGGVQYSHNKLDETGRYVIVDDTDPNYGGTYTSESEKHADEVGVYLQGELSISDALELVAGARYDIHRSEDSFGGSGKVAPKKKIVIEYDEKAFNPRLAVRYSPLKELTLRSSVGTGFRVPYGFSEDLHLCSGSPRVNKPAGLKPEKSLSFNLGADYMAERYLLSANLFRTNLKDKIGFTDASEASKRLGYTYEWTNIDDAYTQGIELGLRALLIRNLELDLNLTYTDAQYEHEREDWVETHGGKYASDSKYIPRVPQVTAGIKLEYSPGEFSLVLDANYTGRMYIDYCEEEDVTLPGSKIVHTPAFWVVNPKLKRSFPGQGITVSVGAKNLFDYVQEERHPDDAAFMYAPYTGRIIYGGVEVEF